MGQLIERDAEIRAVADLLTAVVEGRGGSVVFTGSAGVGRSALALYAHESAQRQGFAVLASNPTPVSPALSHGVARDWFGPLVRGARPGHRPFDGPAAALATELTDPGTHPEVWSLARLDYAVTWALESLAEQRPVLLLVDDVQWADQASLQLVDLLSARLDRTPLGLVLTIRSGEPTQSPDILERLASRALTVEPRPFSVHGVASMQAARTPVPAARSLSAQEVHRRTGGLPFLVAEMLRTGGATPQPVVDSVRSRLDQLGEEAQQVARTVAALGDEASFDAIGDLIGCTVAELADPLEMLTDAGILTLGMWRARPAHPLVAEAILTPLAPSERSRLHREAASYLAQLDRPLQVVAGHLVHTLPGEDRAVVELLRAAGEESLRNGTPHVAASQLRRAVGETRPESTDADLLALAASAHVLAGERVEAIDLWERALTRADGAEERAGYLADMGDAQMTMGGRRDAADSYHRAMDTLSTDGHDSSSPALRRLLVRMGMARVLYDGAEDEIVHAVTDALDQPVDRDTHTDRLLFALAASSLGMRADDHVRARELARRALGRGALLAEEGCEGIGFYVASAALSWADAYEENLVELGAAIEESRRRGAVVGFATASYCAGLARYRQGHLHRALEDFQAALDLRDRGWADFGDQAVAGAARTHLALGQRDEARALEPALRAAAARGHFVSAHPMVVAGAVRAAHGEHHEALADYQRAASLMGDQRDNASIVEWRELSVCSLLALGRADEATELAEQAVTHARRWGAPRSLGFALRTRARVTPPDEAIACLREAAALSEQAGLVDCTARTRIDLARHLLPGSAPEREEGVHLLRSAFDYARRADVPPVLRAATRGLLLAGEMVEDPTTAPGHGLTPGERRVVELAATGETNRRIAQTLFVTVKAVEWHLSNAYRKLGISSRSQLRSVLYGEPDASSSDR